jgi:hypothetical protein
MKIQTLKQIVSKNIDENISLINEVLDMYEIENKEALKKLFANPSELTNNLVFNVLMIYSLLSFIEDKKELEIAQANIDKLIAVEPLVKDVLGIYLNIIEIEDINPNISENVAKVQNKKLVEILSAY